MQHTPLFRLAALFTLIGGAALAAPQIVQNDIMNPSSSAGVPAAGEVPAHAADAPQSSQPSTSVSGHRNGMARVEQRIKTLHAKLKITPDEENDWMTVAQTMRENEAEMAGLIDARHQNPQSMTAIDDLQSYQKITQAHADGLNKMISSFQTLYHDMPDAQKENADQVFGSFEGHGASNGHKKHV